MNMEAKGATVAVIEDFGIEFLKFASASALNGERKIIDPWDVVQSIPEDARLNLVHRTELTNPNLNATCPRCKQRCESKSLAFVNCSSCYNGQGHYGKICEDCCKLGNAVKICNFCGRGYCADDCVDEHECEARDEANQ